MIELEINGEKRSLTDRYESWISERFRMLREQGHEIWVRIRIGGDLNLFLPIGPCPSSGGGGGGLSPRQVDVCNFYRESGISNRPLNQGTLIAFLQKLVKFLAKI